jgi:hypothetical protein
MQSVLQRRTVRVIVIDKASADACIKRASILND